jgi:tetratricopeptide (TPR) repeat protein
MSDSPPASGDTAPTDPASPTVAGAVSEAQAHGETAPSDAAPAGGRSWLAPAFLALLSIALFAPTMSYPFVYDDAFLIINNESMVPARTDIGAAFNLFTQEYWEGVNPEASEALKLRGQALYRPLTLFMWACLSRATDYETVWPFHLLSMLANAWVVVMIFLLVKRFWGRPRVAFVAALLFALHPLHSEAVAYIAGLSDVVSAGAVLLGLLCFERATRDPKRLATGAYIALLVTLFLGLLAKEQAAVLIAAVALTDVMFSLGKRRMPSGARMAIYGGMIAVLAIHVWIRYAAMGYLEPSATAISRLDNPLIVEPFAVRLFTGFKLLAIQVWLFIWPQQLSVDYSFNAIPVARSFSHSEPLAGGILMVVMLIYGLAKLRRSPAIGWGILFFLGCMVFTSNILVPIGTIFGERLMYISTIGAVIAVAMLIDPLLRDPRRPHNESAVNAVGLMIVLAVGGTLGVRTWERNKVFENSIKLFDTAAEVVPESARVHYQLGSLYAPQQLYTKAEEHFKRALEIDDTFIQAAISLGNVYVRDRNWDKAIEVFNDILPAVKPTASLPGAVNEVRRMVYSSLAAAWAGKGDMEKAESSLQQAMSMSSDNADSHVQLAQLYLNRGRPEESIQTLRQALQLRPDDLRGLYLLAQAANAAGDPAALEQAVSGLEVAEGGSNMAQTMRGVLLYEEAIAEGDDAKRVEAMALFEAVRTADPELALPYIYRARFLFEQGRFYDAIIDANRALERAPDQPLALILKARSQNASDRPQEALATLRDLELVNPNVSCYQEMARAHQKLGNIDEFGAAYKKVEELGVPPVPLILDLGIVLSAEGKTDEAIETIQAGLLLEGMHDDTRLLRSMGVLLLDSGRYDEALTTFQQQAAAAPGRDDLPPDAFLPINMARVLMALDRDMEAAAQLEMFEATADPDSRSWPSLLHRRSELLLKQGSPFYDPQLAADLCAEGILKTGGRYPPLLDRRIEALVASGDLPAAIQAAEEAATSFPGIERYTKLIEELKRAMNGDAAGAASTLMTSGDEVLVRTGQKLQ